MQDSFRQFLENNSDKELANNANAFKELGSQFQPKQVLENWLHETFRQIVDLGIGLQIQTI